MNISVITVLKVSVVTSFSAKCDNFKKSMYVILRTPHQLNSILTDLIPKVKRFLQKYTNFHDVHKSAFKCAILKLYC